MTGWDEKWLAEMFSMKPSSKILLGFPETIQQDVFFVHVFVLEF